MDVASEVNMVMNSTPAKVAFAILAVISTVMLLSAFGMFFMHSSMSGGSALQGLWLSLASMCRGMMGG
jgi:hypothetical protein